MIIVLIRAKFAKLKTIRYISHLDLMNILRRTFRRAELPVVYSQGFNPHQKLALGHPLAVGLTGEGEYFDLELEVEIPEEEFVRLVNAKLPPGLRVLEAREVNSDVNSLMAVLDTARYQINFEIDLSEKEGEEILNDLLKQTEIKILRKRRKKKDRMIDIRPLLYDVKIMNDGLWEFVVATGSRGNVRPGEIVEAVVSLYPSVFKEVPIINIKREGLYVMINNELYQPYEQKVVGVD